MSWRRPPPGGSRPGTPSPRRGPSSRRRPTPCRRGGPSWPAWAGPAWRSSEERGGQGYGVAELTVVLEQTGAVCLPGPLLPTAVVATAVERWGDDDDLVTSLASGGVAGLALDSTMTAAGGDDLVVSGRAAEAWSAAVADVVLVPVDVDGARTWCLLDRSALEVRERPSFDPTRRVAEVVASGVAVPRSRQLSIAAEVDALAGVLAAAEGVGVAQWCVDTAAEHARTRMQFGRPIGQFQAVKHRCANMLVRARKRPGPRCGTPPASSTAVTSGLAVTAARALAPAAAFQCAKDCIQVLGGIGYTWEHDAHLFLKRSAAVRHLLPGPSSARASMCWQAAAGHRRALGVTLPEGAEEIRERVKAFVAELARAAQVRVEPHAGRPGLPGAALAEAVGPRRVTARAARDRRGAGRRQGAPPAPAGGGLGAAHDHRPRHPRPAGPLDPVRRCGASCAGARCSASPTPAAISPVSAPGRPGWTAAGRSPVRRCGRPWPGRPTGPSASPAPTPTRRSTRASAASSSTWQTPGIDIRPLRELTGMAMFNEVFLTDVFVPDECVVGPADRRLGSGSHHAGQRTGVDGGGLVVRSGHGGAARAGRGAGRLDDPLVVDRVGGLLVEAHALAALGDPHDAAGPRRRPARSRGERPQADGGRARAGRPGGRARPARSGRGGQTRATVPRGPAASSATAPSRSPAAPARSSAASSPSASSASPRTPERRGCGAPAERALCVTAGWRSPTCGAGRSVTAGGGC